MNMNIYAKFVACFSFILYSISAFCESNSSQDSKMESWNTKKSADIIEYLFDQIPLKEKKILSIGSDWGIDFYLADKFGLQIVDCGTNSNLVAALNKKTPERLRHLVSFELCPSYNALNYPDESFDIVFYRMNDFQNLIEISHESRRLLKKNGLFIVLDCYVWKKDIEESDKKLYGAERFSHIVNEEQFKELFEKNNLALVSTRDDSHLGIKNAQRTLEIFGNKNPKSQVVLSLIFDDKQEDIRDGYLSQLKALEAGELKMLRFVTQK